MNKKIGISHVHIGVCVVALTLMVGTAQARKFTDGHGNVGYSTAAECDAAVADGSAKFYRSFTYKPALKRAGEESVESTTLGDVPGYEKGACDPGAGHSYERDGVSSALIGKFIAFSPDMEVNAYSDATGKIVRLTMKQCDNNFGSAMPRPVNTQAAVSSECFADVMVPAKFETVREKVETVPATVRYEPVAATYKTVTEEVLVQAAMVKQIPIPATYKRVTEKVQVRPEIVRKEPVPPTYKTVSERIVLQPEGKRIKVVPATYKTVTERVLAKEASSQLVTTQQRYETITETVKVADEHRMWKRGRAYIGDAIDVQPLRGFEVSANGRVNGDKVEKGWATADNRNLDDDVMCLVEIPAQYKTITRKVLVQDADVKEVPIEAQYKTISRQVVDTPAHTVEEVIPAKYGTVERRVVDTPASTRDVVIPAEYETISKTVVDQPASYREETIPAVYKTVSRKVVDQPASVREIKIPAQYQTLSHRVIVSEASTERRQILCDTNANRPKIQEIQNALKDAGFNPGPVDGLLRSQTMRAVSKYQQANNLPVDGYLNIETVQALGVSTE